MQTADKLRRHAALLDDMSAKTGVDLQDRVMSGRLSMDHLADVVLRCTECAHAADCEAWLKSDGIAPPDFCLNRKTLLELTDD